MTRTTSTGVARVCVVLCLAVLAALTVTDVRAAAIPSRLVIQLGPNNWPIFTSSPNGEDVQRLDLDGVYTRPTVSPDGTRIAFAGATAGHYNTYEIFIATIDGELLSRVTDNSAPDSSPFWSPDGKRLGFWRGDDRRTLVTARLDGTDEKRLMTRAGGGLGPRWSPNGTYISFDGYRNGAGTVEVIRADGSDGGVPRPITTVGEDAREAAWSPDANHIAVVAQRYIDNAWRYQLRIVDVATAQERVVVSSGAWIQRPAWSPDGTRIAYVLRDNVWITDIAGANRNQVTTHGNATYVDWGRKPACTIEGDGGADMLRGTAGDDLICGHGGNDRIISSGGADVVLGGLGTDKIDYRDADRRLVLDLREQRATSGGVTTRLYGVEGALGTRFNDELFGSDWRNHLSGYLGEDAMLGRGGDDTMMGGGGDDMLRPGGDGDDVDGGDGRDTVSFMGAADRVRVNLGNSLAVGQGQDVLLRLEKVVGSSHDDFIVGGNGSNVLRGGDGEDTLDGMGGPDDLYGGDDRDQLYGRGGSDDLYGGEGRDIIDGGSDNDDCYSGYLVRNC